MLCFKGVYFTTTYIFSTFNNHSGTNVYELFYENWIFTCCGKFQGGGGKREILQISAFPFTLQISCNWTILKKSAILYHPNVTERICKSLYYLNSRTRQRGESELGLCTYVVSGTSIDNKPQSRIGRPWNSSEGNWANNFDEYIIWTWISFEHHFFSVGLHHRRSRWSRCWYESD